MSGDITKILNLLLNAALLSFVAGAAFTFGCALVCRAMAWAPVNTTINVISTVPPANSEVSAA